MIKAVQLAILLAVSTCGGRTENAAIGPVATVSNGKCLEERINFPSELLTEQMVLKLVDTEGKELEVNGSDNNKRTEWNSRDYAWDTGRKGSFQGMELPLMNSISLYSMEVIKAEDPLENFKTTYKILTDEEREKLMIQLREGLKAKLDAGEITEEQYDMSQGFTGVFAKLNYQNIDEKVGDIAIWDATRTKISPVSMGALVVQYGKVRFRINVDVGGENDEASKALAIKVAQSIIASCD